MPASFLTASYSHAPPPLPPPQNVFALMGDQTVHVAAPGGDQSQSTAGGIYDSAQRRSRFLPRSVCVRGLCTNKANMSYNALGTSMACPHVSGLATLLKRLVGTGVEHCKFRWPVSSRSFSSIGVLLLPIYAYPLCAQNFSVLQLCVPQIVK